MSTEIETLSHFFGPPDPRAVKALAKSDAMNRAHAIPQEFREAAADQLVEQSRALLNSPIADIFAEAWKTRRDIRKFADAPPDKINEHPLIGHAIALKRNPKLELTLNGAPTGVTLTFELKLALELDGAHLKVQNARIIGARVGEFLGKGTFSCGDITLFERKTAHFRLPGAISIAPPISIR